MNRLQLFFTCLFVVNFVEKKLQKALGKLVIRDRTEEPENAEEEERR